MSGARSPRSAAAFRPSGSVAPFRPAPGLAGPHAQTIAGKLLRPDLRIPLRRERLETPDGDFVDLDHAGDEATRADPGRPRVLVLHGLEGSARRRYMMTTYRALLEAGFRPVGLNFRGCSGEPNRTVRAYHSGETGDLRFVLEHLRAADGAPAGLVGYSLGGNVALKFLGELGPDAAELVFAAAVASVPFDLAAGADRIEQGFWGGMVYTRYFMRSLRRKVALKADLLRDTCDTDAVARARTIREFDELITARIHGYEDAADYYARSSSERFIDAIRVPTLVVHSKDDPFLPPDRIPLDAMAANPAIRAVITERGGHVGFVGGRPWRPEFWVEGVVAGGLADARKSAR